MNRPFLLLNEGMRLLDQLATVSGELAREALGPPDDTYADPRHNDTAYAAADLVAHARIAVADLQPRDREARLSALWREFRHKHQNLPAGRKP